MFLKNRHVVITGASFIGVHLISKLLHKKVATIKVLNKSSKHKVNLQTFIKDIEFITADLRDSSYTKKLIPKHSIVIHLAADHGGRGYVDLKQGNTASNFLLDGSVFKACLENNVEKVFYASSGCVYPNYLQTNSKSNLYLKETDVKTPYDADNIYGWAKLMGELTLKQYHKDFGLKSAIGRFFTVYGPYASESHAVMATIAKAFIKQDPFLVWGNGTQIRNWTYVEDIVEGIITSLEHIDNALPINFGTTERITVDQMVNMVCTKFKHQPKQIKHIVMPVGPINRVADISLAYKLLKWKPDFTFNQGLEKTIEWYTENKSKKYIRNHLDNLLIHD